MSYLPYGKKMKEVLNHYLSKSTVRIYMSPDDIISLES